LNVRKQLAGSVATRRMQPDDSPALETVFAGLSAQSRYRRFLAPTPRLPASMRRALLDLSDRHVAFVAHGEGTAIGIGRYVVMAPGEIEIALEVVDAWQRRGVGRLLLERVVQAAADAGLHRVVAIAAPDNRAVMGLARAYFPGVRLELRDRTVWLSAALPTASVAAA
jgi:GNAT superfamily N-acetyltransferase